MRLAHARDAQTWLRRRADDLGPWGWRLVAAAMVAAFLAWVPWLFYESDGYARLRRMKAQLAALEQGNAKRKLENEALRRDVRRLRRDPAALGAVARDDLGLVRPGEIVIQLEGAR